MKRKKILALILTIIICIVYSCPIFASQYNETDTKVSAKFINLYSNLFKGTEGYYLFDNNDNDITQSFINEYQSLYEANNYSSLMRLVAENKFVLQHGAQEIIRTNKENNRDILYVYTPWKYVLTELNQLSSGKMAEFDFRAVGGYIVSNSSIAAYWVNTVQYNITNPGDMFGCTVTWTDTSTGNSSYAIIKAQIHVKYTFAYSNNYSQTVNADSYSVTVYP